MSITEQEPIASILGNLKRVVIKVGTRVIDDEATHFNRPIIESLVSEIAQLRSRGIDVLLVTSGAVGAGLRTLNVPKRPASAPLRQAYAAVGQGRLMHLYSELFARHGLITAQVLLTRYDLGRRESYLNARETLQHLLTIGVIPIINENDTVAVEELTFGDNDVLAALVAGGIGADLLVLLTTVDGLFRAYDDDSKSGQLIECVDGDFVEARQWIQPKNDTLSMGGMESKLEAARKASLQGALTAIANGHRMGIIGQLLNGDAPATWIMPNVKKLGSWKYYLAYAKQPCNGQIVVDEGAARAIRENGKSLLASGIRRVDGIFRLKDMVRIVDLTDNEIARGLVNYSSEELKQIQGQSSQAILERFSDRPAGVVVHRNNLVLA